MPWETVTRGLHNRAQENLPEEFSHGLNDEVGVHQAKKGILVNKGTYHIPPSLIGIKKSLF
jgi:hypothetical protein